MEEKNELNDIILNKNKGASGNKKVILAVATLGVVLIIVVMLMNTLSSNSQNNLPQAVLPPEPKVVANDAINEEPLFEEVKVEEESSKNEDSLNKIAQKLKEESKKEQVASPSPAPVIKETKKVAKKPVVKTTPKPVAKKPEVKNTKLYYVQVGSFSKYAPNKKFLDSILSNGYQYKFHKANKMTKVLVGPFYSEKEARSALKVVKKSIEPGAFLTRI